MAGFRQFRRANIRVESVNSMCLPKFLILFAYSSTVSVCICCFVKISLPYYHFKIAGCINLSANTDLRCANVSLRSSGRFDNQSFAVNNKHSRRQTQFVAITAFLKFYIRLQTSPKFCCVFFGCPRVLYPPPY